ncbi:hypothetical protein FQN57_003995 [Myotisia sp. PD_48]|nr:hypothetical protein FQN57_003995 [Myotisia sp. PD_48]
MLSTSLVSSALWRNSRAYQIFGANTDVGKTVISTVLCNAVPAYKPWSHHKLWFLKPVSAGPGDAADDNHLRRFTRGTLTKCLHGYDKPVSPHLAAHNQHIPSNEELLDQISSTLNGWALQGPGVALVETAGGVLSPGPTGTVQADLYRPLRLPVILVADPKLGGISSSISAYESLTLRGYDVEGIVLFQDQYYRNHDYLSEFFGKKNVQVFSLPAPPPRLIQEGSDNTSAVLRDRELMTRFYEESAKHDEIRGLMDELSAKHSQRVTRLDSMAQKAKDLVWYPFTQHHGMTPRDITVIDSAYGDCFQTLRCDEDKSNVASVDSTMAAALQPTFDGSASWWTQGLGHGNPELALTSAYAAGRYGHVMFAGTIHEPALAISELMVQTSGNPRMQKVFFSDNGSTGMEVALKMGLRASSSRYNWNASEETIGILGLSGSYHGDTIGVMDCSEPSTYNKKVEWYRGRGYWFDFPRVQMSRGRWSVTVPDALKEQLGEDTAFISLSSIFDINARKNSAIAGRYRTYIKETIEELVVRQGRKFGALIIEPVILGAGGMLFSDPLFQHLLVQVIRENPQLFSKEATFPTEPNSWSGLPIIFDEVFSGLYRLGRRTAASFLGVDPDICVNAKLLTGGLMPLCTTLASNEIFEVFDSPHKSDALLHGHSYTANPVGCSVAVSSVQQMKGMEESGYWRDYMKDWVEPTSEPVSAVESSTTSSPTIWSCWSRELVQELSFAPTVDSVFAIGTVLSITLKDQQGGGYTSTAASGLREKLTLGNGQFNMHCRVLGNVLYLMASVTSKRDVLGNIEQLLKESLV